MSRVDELAQKTFPELAAMRKALWNKRSRSSADFDLDWDIQSAELHKLIEKNRARAK